MTHHNVVIFGEIGSGKSSLINMLVGLDVAATSSSAYGCTFRSQPFNVNIENNLYTLRDTAGVGEGDPGSVLSSDAIVQLYSVMKKLPDGISLLLFVMSAPARLRESTHSTWKLFTEIVCRNEVPAAMVITGLEHEGDMDAWWAANQDRFAAIGIYPSIHACITTIKGRMPIYDFQDKYNESREKMLKIISAAHLYYPWQMEPIEWLNRVVWGPPVYYVKGAVEDLVGKCGVSREDAERLAKKLGNV